MPRQTSTSNRIYGSSPSLDWTYYEPEPVTYNDIQYANINGDTNVPTINDYIFPSAGYTFSSTGYKYSPAGYYNNASPSSIQDTNDSTINVFKLPTATRTFPSLGYNSASSSSISSTIQDSSQGNRYNQPAITKRTVVFKNGFPKCFENASSITEQDNKIKQLAGGKTFGINICEDLRILFNPAKFDKWENSWSKLDKPTQKTIITNLLDCAKGQNNTVSKNEAKAILREWCSYTSKHMPTWGVMESFINKSASFKKLNLYVLWDNFASIGNKEAIGWIADLCKGVLHNTLTTQDVNNFTHHIKHTTPINNGQYRKHYKALLTECDCSNNQKYESQDSKNIAIIKSKYLKPPRGHKLIQCKLRSA